MPFTLNTANNKITITDSTSGMSAEIYQEEGQYRYKNFGNTSCITPKRQISIARRMVDWYYYNHVRKK